MRLWLSGPRLFGHRTGISLGPEDFRRLKRATTSAPDRRPSAFVYVIRNTATGRVKIGMGADPRERLAALQTGSSDLLELVYAAAVKSNNGNAVEFAAFDILDRHRMAGEWFAITPEIAVAAIAAASHKLKDAIVEIPIERIGEVLEIAARLDAAQPKPRRAAKLLWIAGAVLWAIVVAQLLLRLSPSW